MTQKHYSETTDAEIVATLEAVVAENPGYVYEAPYQPLDDVSCYYVHSYEDGDAAPGCVVGHVFHRLGVPLETLAAHESASAWDVVTTLIPEVGEDVAKLLDHVQGAQDYGEPWAVALETARINAV